MPTNYQSTSQWRDASPSPSQSPEPEASPFSDTPQSPSRTTPWSRRSLSSSSPHRRRLSDHAARSSSSRAKSAGAYLRRGWAAYLTWAEASLATFKALTPLQKAGVVGAIVLGWVLLIVTILYTGAFFAWLGPVAKKWRQLPAGWLINFFLIFVTAFPPVIGYSTASTVAGFVYGFPLGWPIASAACTLGSLAAFVASRTVLGGVVERWVGSDPRFMALGQVMRKEGLLYLTAIRFCPLPFSLSNGFLATIPSITPTAFALSTFLSSPKLLVHIFIGSRLAILVEEGDTMSFRDKAINWTSMAVGGTIGLAFGYIIYKRTMARAAAIAHEQSLADAEEGGAGGDGDGSGNGNAGYMDSETTLLDPEDAAAIMDDDDLSMWETQGGDWSGEERFTDDADGRGGKKDKSDGKAD